MSEQQENDPVVDPRDGEVCCSRGCVEGTPGTGACLLAQPLPTPPESSAR